MKTRKAVPKSNNTLEAKENTNTLVGVSMGSVGVAAGIITAVITSVAGGGVLIGAGVLGGGFYKLLADRLDISQELERVRSADRKTPEALLKENQALTLENTHLKSLVQENMELKAQYEGQKKTNEELKQSIAELTFSIRTVVEAVNKQKEEFSAIERSYQEREKGYQERERESQERERESKEREKGYQAKIAELEKARQEQKQQNEKGKNTLLEVRVDSISPRPSPRSSPRPNHEVLKELAQLGEASAASRTPSSFTFSNK